MNLIEYNGLGKYVYWSKGSVESNRLELHSCICHLPAAWPWTHQLTIFHLNSHIAVSWLADLTWPWHKSETERENLTHSKRPIHSHYPYNSNDGSDLCVRLSPAGQPCTGTHLQWQVCASHCWGEVCASFPRRVHFFPTHLGRYLAKLTHGERERGGYQSRDPHCKEPITSHNPAPDHCPQAELLTTLLSLCWTLCTLSLCHHLNGRGGLALQSFPVPSS